MTLGARMLKAYGGSAYRQELETAIKSLSDRLPTQTWVDLQKLAEEHVLFGTEAKVDRIPHACGGEPFASKVELHPSLVFPTPVGVKHSRNKKRPRLLRRFTTVGR